MNTKPSNLLVDEDELRAAVRFFDLDANAFDSGVHERVRQLATVRPTEHDEQSESESRGLLRIAASVLPVNLLGGSTKAVYSTLAAAGFAKKWIAYLALPATSFLMIAVTIVAFFRIRKAQQTEGVVDAAVVQMNEAVKGWWRRYGCVAAIVFALALISPFTGWTTPLLLAFMASALATTSLVVTLGKAGLVDRGTVSAYCIPIMGLLGQLSISFSISNSTSLLDPKLITATFSFGVGVLAFFARPFSRLESSEDSDTMVSRAPILMFVGIGSLIALGLLSFLVPNSFMLVAGLIVLIGLGLLFVWLSPLRVADLLWCSILFAICTAIVGFFTQTLWRPATTQSMVQYVETFEADLLGRWKGWQVSAEWLDEQGIEYDPSGVRERILTTIETAESRSYLIPIAAATGLMPAAELVQSEDVLAFKERLLKKRTAGTDILSIEQHEYMIAALAEAGNVSSSQKDHIAGQLMATWSSLDDRERGFHVLEHASIITRLLVKLDRSPELATRQTDVRRWLDEYQVKNQRVFRPSGGFDSSRGMDYSDASSTEAAVRLMQHYGVTEVVDVLALRSFLRPKADFRLMIHTEAMKTATRERLNHVPGISMPTISDYLRCDKALWFAMLLVGLCIYATLGSPNLIKPATADLNPKTEQ